MIRQLDHAPPELADIHAACFDRPWSAGVLSDLAVKTHHRLYVVEDNGCAVSFVVLMSVAGEAEILTLATDPRRQKQGHARRLLNHLIASLKAEGHETLFLEVAVDNAAALALYTACGFERVGLRKAYYTRSGGAPVDGHMLRLAL